MKKHFLLFAIFCLCPLLEAQIITITDASFKAKLLAANPENITAIGFLGSNYIKIDANDDGEIETEEAQAVRYLNISNYGSDGLIVSLEGINGFTNLQELYANSHAIAAVDLNLPNLTALSLSANLITTIDLSNEPLLKLLAL